MNALATAPGVISPAGKYYISANEVMEYLGCKENKAYELIRQEKCQESIFLKDA